MENARDSMDFFIKLLQTNITVQFGRYHVVVLAVSNIFCEKFIKVEEIKTLSNHCCSNNL